MVQDADHAGLLRARDGGDQRVTPLELFFDLIFVFAVTLAGQASFKWAISGLLPWSPWAR
jgi:low temperature requirement protein LtrA